MAVQSRSIPSASPLPTQPEAAFVTLEPAQLDRWQEYEHALARKLLSSIPVERALCEWQVLAQSSGEVYVWATCTGNVLVGQVNPGYPTASMPAAVILNDDGTVRTVDIPGPGTHYAQSIREMFPEDVQESIFGNAIDYRRLSDHLRWRREHPEEPPLVVLEATSSP
jgi:hypothetical protein